MTYQARLRFFFGGALLLLLLFLWQSAALLSATRDAMHLAAHTILPSLFPYLVLSGILSATAAPDILPGARVFEKLSRLPAIGFIAFFLGSVCGFPIGARVSGELYRNGCLQKEEAARLAAVSTNAGPAFAVAGVGGALFGSPSLGWLLFLAQLAAALLLTLLSSFFTPRPQRRAVTPHCGGASFSDILGRATVSALGIAGAVIFFGGVAALLPPTLPLSVSAFIKAILEVGNGCAAAAMLGKGGLPLAAFAIGFSGISVLFQAIGELRPLGIPILPLVRFKLCQGTLSALLILPFCLGG